MLAEVVDAVVGGDTHRDTYALELTAPSGATIATLMIGNDERGFAEAITWVAEHACGWWSGSRAPAATESGWPGCCKPRD
jgi:transposase